MLRHPDFYVLNSSRPYPLDDAATITDDAGNFLPHHIITDLYLVFPDTAGQFAFLGGVTISPRLVTVTILADSSSSAQLIEPLISNSPGNFTPLATVSLPKPIVTGRHYALSPFIPGVGGWIVFGEGTVENYSGKFSSSRQ